MDDPRLYSSALAAAISYFILIFTGEIAGIGKVKRLVISLLIGVLYFHYGETVSSSIKAFFATLGL